MIEDKDVRGLLIEIEHKNELEVEEFKLALTVMLHACALISKWKESKLIESACAM